MSSYPFCRRRKLHPLQLMFLLMMDAVILLCIFVSGCSNNTCDDNHSALPMMTFYGSGDESLTPIILDSLDISGVGAPNDSLLVSAGESLYTLYLPFRFDHTSTSFRFHYAYKMQGLDNPEFDDIVTFHYTAMPYFASEECGAFYIFNITGVDYTKHLIDSVVIVDSLITNVDMERIRVYFRIQQPEEPGDDETGDDNSGEGDEGEEEAGAGEEAVE